MEIVHIKTKFNKGVALKVSQDEALRLVSSLVAQITNNSCNSGRLEFRTKKQEYVSIFVVEQKA